MSRRPARRAAVPSPTGAALRRELAPTLERLVATARRAFDADAAALYLVDPGDGDLVLRAASGLPEDAIGHRLALGEGLLGRAAAEARSLVSEDVAFDPRARRRRPDWETAPRARAFLGVPLRAGPVVLGALELLRRREAPFTPEDRGRAAVFADAAGLLVERTRLTSEPPPAALEGAPASGSDPIGIAALNRRLLVTSASPAFCAMVGLPVESVVGRPAIAVLPALGRPRARDALEAALRGAPAHLGGVRPPAEERGPEAGVPDYSLSLIPLGDASRGSEGVLLALQDVSARARLEEELRAQTAGALEARDRLRAVIEVISHELRTPLTSVLGFARLLQDRPDAERSRREGWAAKVIEKARLMARLVEEISELARLGSTEFSLERRPTDLEALVRGVASSLDDALEGHPVSVEVQPGLPRVSLDPDRIEQVVGNLLTNAAKFWRGEGAIVLRLWGRGDRVTVEVEDRGPGIPPDEIERIFEPFYRVRAAASREVPGTGLGLAVCRAIVEAHGGTIEAENRPEGGAAFRFTLPTSPEAPQSR